MDDGYQILKDHPELVAAIERMANVKIIFEEDLPSGTDEHADPEPGNERDRLPD